MKVANQVKLVSLVIVTDEKKDDEGTSQLSGEILFSMKLWMKEQTPSSLRPWHQIFYSHSDPGTKYFILTQTLPPNILLRSIFFNLDVESQTPLVQGGEPPACLIVAIETIDSRLD